MENESHLTAKFAQLLEKFYDLEAQMASGDLSVAKMTDMSRQYASMEDVVNDIKQYESYCNELESLNEMRQDDDPEMRDMAQTEFYQTKDNITDILQKIKIKLLPKDEADSRNIIIEIRAGTGGDEAALFAADLCRMYQRYSANKGWKSEILDSNESGIGGLQQVSLSIQGQDVYGKLKFESGVHRVQRVPVTESSGRIHTSAATVAVMPEAEDVDIAIEEKDLRIDTYRAQGAGGQHINTTDSAVRITHIPTDIVVQCQDERSQIKNRAKAMKILRAKLFEVERERIASERADMRRDFVGSGDRSERIRTYNYPQGRISDHRINLTLYKLPMMMEGELDELIEALIISDQAARIAAFEQEDIS